jgi:hypothetical protein
VNFCKIDFFLLLVYEGFGAMRSGMRVIGRMNIMRLYKIRDGWFGVCLLVGATAGGLLAGMLGAIEGALIGMLIGAVAACIFRDKRDDVLGTDR